MSPSPTVNVLAVPAGRGKTRKYAVRRMLRETNTKFLYVAPQLAIIDEVEDQISKLLASSSIFARIGVFSRIDSRQATRGPVSARLERELGAQVGELDFTARIVCVTHQSLWHLTSEMVQDRVVIVDEMPAFLEFLPTGRAKTWQRLLSDPALISDQEGIVALTDDGRAELRRRAVSDLEKAIHRTLRMIDRAPTRRMSPKCLLQTIPAAPLAAALELIVMAAVPDAGYFPEWCHLNGFRQQELAAEAHGLDARPHRCVNTEIFYAFESRHFASKSKLCGPWGAALGRLAKDAKAEGGSLHHFAKTEYLAAVNLGAKAPRQYLSPKRVLSPVVRGLNAYRDCTVMFWFAALQPDPHEIQIVQTLCSRLRTAKEIIRSRHIEAAYQFVMRGKLREGDGFHVKILVPTRADAEALAELLGTNLVSQCSNVPARFRSKVSA